MAVSPLKCPKHNTWMRKYRNKGEPICERCLMEKDALRKEREATGGSNHMKVKVISL